MDTTTRLGRRLSLKSLKATLCKRRIDTTAATTNSTTTTNSSSSGNNSNSSRRPSTNPATTTNGVTATSELSGGGGKNNSKNTNSMMLKFNKYKSKQGKEGLWKTIRRKFGRRKCRDSSSSGNCEEVANASCEEVVHETDGGNVHRRSRPPNGEAAGSNGGVSSPFRLARRTDDNEEEEDGEVEGSELHPDLSADSYATQENSMPSPSSPGSERDPRLPNATSVDGNIAATEDIVSMQSNNSTSNVPRPLFYPFEKELSCPVPEGLYLYETPKIRSLTRELFKLSKHGWYWGPITRMEAEEKLMDQPDGAFLVRDSSDDRHLLSLSFRSYGKTLHTRIEHCNGLFSFYAQPEPEGHSSIIDLIDHSMNYSQAGVFCYSRARSPGSPSFPVRLTKPVSRFTQVRSLQYLCRFIIRQYTRFDHIQKLPLPSRIKGYIEEGHY